ncbi:transmembrane protease serine 9-like [Oppia nitens]|uniref:transmembrane protease serine 9-like n=1 Tax=Oppia nitens TaxID=1686743 RepID=UPI0023DC701C|nr:transmembrane protease serine 9-like [Oppia nitens]
MCSKFLLVLIITIICINIKVNDGRKYHKKSMGTDKSSINYKNCGITKKKAGNIVGGEKAAEYEFPWIVSFQRPKGNLMVHFCGGSIINDRWLLTAAHCFQGVFNTTMRKMKAVVGTTQWASIGTNGAAYEFEGVFNHENYDPEVYANDISLIKTKKPIEFSDSKTMYFINSVCISDEKTKLPATATVYGWGYLKEEGEPSPDLMKVTVSKYDTKLCNDAYQEFVGNFTPQMFCYMSPGKDSCKGDSGGPLTAVMKKKGTQIGIVSFGHGCARPKTPGIYQEVGKFHDWIVETINKYKYHLIIKSMLFKSAILLFLIINQCLLSKKSGYLPLVGNNFTKSGNDFYYQKKTITTTNVYKGPSTRINPSNCGKIGISGRIVGGNEADIRDFPWMVSFQKTIGSKYEHICGGSIINPRWILTAGHCFFGHKHSLGKIRAMVGSTNLNDTNEGNTYNIEKLVIHENFERINYNNDIALIKVKHPIEYKNNGANHFVNCVCLPAPNDNPPKNVRVYGWGRLGQFDSVSKVLMKVNLQKSDTSKCNDVYRKYVGQFTKEMICYTNPGKDACQGDSGGPLSAIVNEKEYQFGIVSFGQGCNENNYPGVYTNVALYRDWIIKTIKK